ncbi:hypothetical protein J6590_065742 [Homalodisca vitripennis]|nr:hypothetical protein J6590_065742 [Homalodisca vitripennis]
MMQSQRDAQGREHHDHITFHCSSSSCRLKVTEAVISINNPTAFLVSSSLHSPAMPSHHYLDDLAPILPLARKWVRYNVGIVPTANNRNVLPTNDNREDCSPISGRLRWRCGIGVGVWEDLGKPRGFARISDRDGFLSDAYTLPAQHGTRSPPGPDCPSAHLFSPAELSHAHLNLSLAS